MPRFTRLAALPLALALVTGAAPVFGQEADFTAFRAACAQGAAFLVGDVPAGADVAPVLAVLCPCLETGFAGFSQPEIDALAADLRTGTSDEARAAYPAYEELKAKATGVLGICFSSPEVLEAARRHGLSPQ